MSQNKFPNNVKKTAPASPTQQTKGTILVPGDSMLHEIDENGLSRTKQNIVKVRTSRGATVDDIKDFLKPSFKHSPTNMALHIGTNNSINYLSGTMLNKLRSLKHFIQTVLSES